MHSGNCRISGRLESLGMYSYSKSIPAPGATVTLFDSMSMTILDNPHNSKCAVSFYD